MPDKSRELREVPPLFLAGVLTNWAGAGVLAWKPQWIAGVVVLLTIGTLVMFLGAYESRPRRADSNPSDDVTRELPTK